LEDADKGVTSTGRYVMSDVNLFRQLAEEAMRDASEAISENEKRNLELLACTWAEAALMSDRVFGSSFAQSPCGIVASDAPPTE
jgi:hypothetical protein